MPSNPAVCRVAYCTCCSYVGNRKLFVIVVAVMLFHVKCEDLPRNVVVMAGSDKVLNCAQGGPFRWYRYLPSDPSDDKVLFMGSQMADNLDERFRVLKEPQNYPFERLDLLITDIQANHSGTYKCKQSQSALCAEVIVLGSEPNCRIQVSKDTTTKGTVELKCSVDVTENGEPEMLCVAQNEDTLTETSCSTRHNGMVTCMTRVPAEMQADYTCIVKIKPKPHRTYKTCPHAANEPDYRYTWQSSSGVNDDEVTVSNRFTQMSKSLCYIIGSCFSAVLNIIFVIVLCVLCVKRRMKDRSSTSSVESSECASLNSEKQYETKDRNYNVYSTSSCLPPKIDVEKQV